MNSRRVCACLAATALAAAAAARAGDAAAVATPAPAAFAGDVDTLEAQLSGIDFLPDRERLDAVAPSNPANDLLSLCDDPQTRAGRRLRALRSLAQYPSPRVRTALVKALTRYRDAESGMELVYLRATIESLARLGGDDTAVVIGGLLEHRSPDVRAAAARGLGDLGDPAATGLLFRQLDVEKVPFVRAAVERALRDLPGF